MGTAGFRCLGFSDTSLLRGRCRTQRTQPFGQGLEASNYWLVFWAVQVLSFVGFTFSPSMCAQPERRQGVLILLAVLAFLLDEVLSFAFIAFGMFPD